MSKYYYNGVLLPEIPQVAGHPYTYIYQDTGIYIALYTNSILFYNSSTLMTSDATSMHYYVYDGTGEIWSYAMEETHDSLRSVVWPDDTPLIYINVDIPFTHPTNTEIYMSASEPIPEGGASETFILVPKSDMVTLADSIRAKTGLIEDMSVEEMTTAISSIPKASGGTFAYGIDTFAKDIDNLFSITIT